MSEARPRTQEEDRGDGAAAELFLERSYGQALKRKLLAGLINTFVIGDLCL